MIPVRSVLGQAAFPRAPSRIFPDVPIPDPKPSSVQHPRRRAFRSRPPRPRPKASTLAEVVAHADALQLGAELAEDLVGAVVRVPVDDRHGAHLGVEEPGGLDDGAHEPREEGDLLADVEREEAPLLRTPPRRLEVLVAPAAGARTLEPREGLVVRVHDGSHVGRRAGQQRRVAGVFYLRGRGRRRGAAIAAASSVARGWLSCSASS